MICKPSIEKSESLLKSIFTFKTRSVRRGFSTTLILFSGIIALGAAGLLQAQSPGIVPATMTRTHDPIQVPCDLLGGLHGKKIDNLRVYSHRAGKMGQIIYQIDERLENGIFVFDLGIAKNSDKANGLLDPQDFVVFRISDTGDRAPSSEWPVKNGIEIELEDPLSKNKSYVYLLHFESNAPARMKEDTISLKHYDPWARPDMPFVVQGYSYTIEGFVNKIGNRFYKTAINKSFSVPPEAGGTGVNFLDGMRSRAYAELFFGKTKIDFNETNMIGGIDAIKQGNIRGYGLQWMTVALPLGLEGPRLYNDVFTYDRMVVAPMIVNVPVNPQKVITRAGIEYGYDLNESAYGMRFYSEHCPNGVDIDGKMDAAEKAMSQKWPSWWLITGPQGSMIFRLYFNPEFLKQVNASFEYTDDRNIKFPPEDVEGSIGYSRNMVEITSVVPGKYEARVEWYFPPHFYKNGGYDKVMLQEFFNVIDNPVVIRVAGKTAKNTALTPPKLRMIAKK